MPSFAAPAARTADAVRATEHYALTWRSIAIVVAYTPAAIGPADCRYNHLEVMSAVPRRPLPITETGYKSLFLPAGEIEAHGGPLAYVMRWLDHAGRSSRWQAVERDSRQGSLF